MPTVTLRKKDGTAIKTVKSHLLVANVDTTTHCLHLHHDAANHWVVSDPVSGGKVLHVYGSYQGIRTASRGYSLKHIRPFAQSQLDELIERVGSDRFNQVLGRAGEAIAA